MSDATSHKGLVSLGRFTSILGVLSAVCFRMCLPVLGTLALAFGVAFATRRGRLPTGWHSSYLFLCPSSSCPWHQTLQRPLSLALALTILLERVSR